MTIRNRVKKFFKRKTDGRNKVWTTRDGDKIRIKDLENGHLLNIIRFLERAHNRNVNAMHMFSCFIMGEQATIDIEQQIDHAEDGGPAYSFPLYDDLENEARRRGIIQEARYV